MTRRLVFAGLVGVVMTLLGLGLLVGNAQQQVQNARITVSVHPGTTVEADVLQKVKRGAVAQSILIALSTGVPTRPQHWTDFTTDATGAYSFQSDDDALSPLAPRRETPTFVQPAALPFAAGLGIVVATLFVAAARWRSPAPA